jgi:MEDS: MEthanogen/methylotroph, DcmR Sensory domain
MHPRGGKVKTAAWHIWCSWSVAMTMAAQLDLGAFLHPALFYQSEQEYVDGVLPFINEGLQADQRVLVAYPDQIWSCCGMRWVPQRPLSP